MPATGLSVNSPLASMGRFGCADTTQALESGAFWPGYGA